jgi:Family of unknown function (DUF6502)
MKKNDPASAADSKRPRQSPAKRQSVAKDNLVELSRDNLKAAIDRLFLSFIDPKSVETSDKLPIRKKLEALEHSEYVRMKNIANALFYWHSKSEFLDSTGNPRALAEKGKHSLTSLSKLVSTSAKESRTVLNDLVTFGVVKCDGGTFLPTNRSAVLGIPNPLTLSYSALAISRLINTITHNLSGAPLPRYERQVSEVRIRAEDTPVFLRFIEQQAQYLIDSVDDWLEHRSVQKNPRETDMHVGLSAFAWVDAVKPKQQPASGSSQSRRLRK